MVAGGHVCTIGNTLGRVLQSRLESVARLSRAVGFSSSSLQSHLKAGALKTRQLHHLLKRSMHSPLAPTLLCHVADQARDASTVDAYFVIHPLQVLVCVCVKCHGKDSVSFLFATNTCCQCCQGLPTPLLRFDDSIIQSWRDHSVLKPQELF